ncbi:hypothetical protein TKK_0017892 [Trichogramma kaykai]|uniref:Small ribosomal subunit protein mS39 n=1 Tax=Trichogramma kaykai TaxID=54128 RepID=A0ABD2W2L0_9HYME
MNSLISKLFDRKVAGNALLQIQALASVSARTSSSNPIKIPNRIERGPTDILEALETTIHRDPTAADYKYIDDPFLIPNSLSKKRTYSLSRESGKKAAMWILQQHPDLLTSELSEPLIEAFLPPKKYESKDQVTEEILLKFISKGQVTEAIHIYNLLDKNVSKSAKQCMLEMLCFYNSHGDQIPEEFTEERSYQQEKEISKNIWMETAEIEAIFGELRNDPETAPQAYSALISGTAKYLKVDRAWKLYEECLQKNIPISVSAYNMLMQIVPLLKDNNEERKALLLTLLQDMVKQPLRPNVGTLNSMLKSISTLQTQGLSKTLSLDILTEFKNFGITPSLGTYYYLLLIFCRQNGPTSHILLEILDELEAKPEFEMQDPADRAFFGQAMEVAAHHIQNMEAGHRLHKLLLTKDNYKFIGGRLKESVYYRNYLQLILMSETLEVFMNMYDTLVPNVYIPEPAVMRNIVEMLELNEKSLAIHHLPKLMSQMVQFDMLDRHQIMKLTFRLMVKHCSPKEKDSPLHKQYAEMAWTVWTHIQESNQRRVQRYMWPADVFGNMSVLLVRGNEFEKMLDILNFLVKSPDSTMGNISFLDLQELFKAAIDRGHTESAMLAIEYASESGFSEVTEMSKTMVEMLPLSESQERKLDELVSGSMSQSRSNEKLRTAIKNPAEDV